MREVVRLSGVVGSETEEEMQEGWQGWREGEGHNVLSSPVKQPKAGFRVSCLRGMARVFCSSQPSARRAQQTRNVRRRLPSILPSTAAAHAAPVCKNAQSFAQARYTESSPRCQRSNRERMFKWCRRPRAANRDRYNNSA